MIRWISLIAVLIIAVNLLRFPATAVAEQERTGISFEWTETNEVVHPVGYYYSEKRFEKMPATFEAWVYLPQEVYAEPAGVVLSNFWNTSDHSLQLEIAGNGVPVLAFGHREGEAYGRTYTFTNATIPSEQWTHLAIVYGTGAEDKQVCCYINGELKQSTEPNYYYEPDPSILDNYVCLGGNFRTMNTEAFRGSLGDLAVYSDARTPEEILGDMENKPDTGDADLMLCYELFGAKSGESISDASGNSYDMHYGRMWLTEEERSKITAGDDKEYTYTIAFIPDPQESTRNFPEKLEPLFDFLEENAESKNIKYVVGLGDMTDKNVESEWEFFKGQVEKLNDKVPYALVRGNHDVLYHPDKITTLHDNYFSQTTDYYYNHVKENGGFHYDDTTINTYLLFEVGKVKYLLLNLDFGASDDVLAWADTVLSEHKDRRAIIATHAYLNGDGTPLVGEDVIAPSLYSPYWNDGDDIWEKLVRKHENIDMVVSGHVGVDSILCSTATGDNGNTVYQLLMNTQGTDLTLGGLGMVGLMHFTEDGRFARVEYYSTVLDRYFRETNYSIHMDFGEAAPAVNRGLIVVGAAVLVAVAALAVILQKKKGKKS